MPEMLTPEQVREIVDAANKPFADVIGTAGMMQKVVQLQRYVRRLAMSHEECRKRLTAHLPKDG